MKTIGNGTAEFQRDFQSNPPSHAWPRLRNLGKPLSGAGPIIGALIIICIVLGLSTNTFFTWSNFLSVIAQSTVVGIASVGATLVIIAGGIDLSVGSAVGLAGIIAGGFMFRGQVGGGGGLLIALGTGIVFGVFNGVSVGYGRMVPFIVTLATLAMGRGLALALSGGVQYYNFPDSFNFLGGGEVWRLPVAGILMVLCFVVGHILLSRTVFGHQIYALGGNREAARLAGIKVRRVETIIYIVAGFFAGLAAIVLTGQLSAAVPSAGIGLELQVIAAVVIGGGSLAGGRGSVIGTFVGVLLIAVINNGLTLLSVNAFWTQFVQGFVIFAAVMLDVVARGRAGFWSGLRSQLRSLQRNERTS